MYRIGICDDGVNTCADLEKMILQYLKQKNQQAETLIWYTGEALHDYLAGGNRLDILFLDIELYEMTGIELGNYIRTELENREMQIVYISGKESYALQLFRTQPVDFLVKPIEQEQVNETMDLALRMLENKKEKFAFRLGKECYHIPIGDILYFESRGRKIQIVTRRQSYEIYGRMREIKEKLSERFLVIHQSFIVNQDHILRYAYEEVELAEGTILPIAKAKRREVRQRILREG